MRLTTETIVTGSALLIGLGLIAYVAIAERRPRKGLNPRLIPTTPILFIGAVMVLLSVLHILTMAGVQLPGRR